MLYKSEGKYDNRKNNIKHLIIIIIGKSTTPGHPCVIHSLYTDA